MNRYLIPRDIYLPDFDKTDGTKWASVACDQYTSEPQYWEAAYDYSKDSPSTLNLMLPEAFLSESDKRIPEINRKMKEYLESVLVCHPQSMIYLERTQSDGKIRRGIVGAVDLEMYDYNVGSDTLIRATEGTVLERIPPRVEVRRHAALEMPHIMMLIDDPRKTVIEPISVNSDKYTVAYDFDLWAGAGHVCGRFIDGKGMTDIDKALGNLASTEEMRKKYGIDCPPLLFAVGDGNHSLASAKALYEEIKAEIGDKEAKNHPSRYALCEVVNLHDDALEFEPIYRVVFGADREIFISEFSEFASKRSGTGDIPAQKITCISDNEIKEILIENPESNLAVGSVQTFLDEFTKKHRDVKVDYIHGVDSVKGLVEKKNAIGLLFDGMKKNELFKTVICDGALPRKTFSMGHAADKRFYIECRKIR